MTSEETYDWNKVRGIRIGLISQNCVPGFTIFRSDLIKKLVSEGAVVFAFACDYTDETKKLVSDIGAFPVEYTLDRSGFNVLKDLFSILELYILFRKFKLDSVLSFFQKPALYGSFAAFLARVPIRIAMFEGLGYIYTASISRIHWKTRALKIFHGILCSVFLRCARKILFLNNDDLSDLKKNSICLGRKLVCFGPIGLDLQHYNHRAITSSKSIHFLFIGRILRDKGVIELLTAARRLVESYPDIIFDVVGDLDYGNPSALGSEDLLEFKNCTNIKFHGQVSDVKPYIQNCHVFVLPSYREGFSRSIQEAMAIGRAVITTDTPGCRQAVSDGINGFLIRPRNSDELLRAIKRFIDDRTLIMSMGNASRAIAERSFDSKKINTSLVRYMSADA